MMHMDSLSAWWTLVIPPCFMAADREASPMPTPTITEAMAVPDLVALTLAVSPTATGPLTLLKRPPKTGPLAIEQPETSAGRQAAAARTRSFFISTPCEKKGP